MTRLLRVIAPDHDESCMGWPLRLAGANHLSSPWHLFRVADLSQSNMCVLQFSVDKFSKLTGLTPAAIRPIACTESTVRSARVAFREHEISRKLVRNRIPRLCPHCVAERPVALAVWDLEAIVACPRHRVLLVDRCHECQHRLSWLRPSIGACRCGANLGKVPTRSASAGLVFLSAAIEVSVLRDVAAWRAAETPSQRLLAAFAETPLQQMVGALSEIARLSGVATRNYPACESANVGNVVGEILLGWPASLHSVFESFATARLESSRMQPRHGGELGVPDVMTSELEKYTQWTRKAASGERDFLSDEMLRCISIAAPHIGTDARNQQRMQGAEVVPEWIPARLAAKRLNIHLQTLLELTSTNRLESKTEVRGKVRRLLVKASSLSEELKRDRVVGLRETIRVTGLPAKVLMSLKASGHLPNEYKGPGSGFVAAQDLETFKTRWSSIRTCKMRPGAESTNVFAALRWKLGHRDLGWKAELVRRILEGTIATYSVAVSPRLDANVDTATLLELRASFATERLGFGQAANSLGLLPMGMMQLAVAGMLEPSFVGTDMYFSQEQLQAFRAKYVRLSTLTSSAKVGRMLDLYCKAKGMETVAVASRHGLVAYAPRSKAVALLSELKASAVIETSRRPKKKGPSAVAESPSMVL